MSLTKTFLVLLTIVCRVTGAYNPCQVITSGGATAYGDVVVVTHIREDTSIGHVIANISMTGNEDEFELSGPDDPLVTLDSPTSGGPRVHFEPSTGYIRVIKPLWIVSFPSDATLKIKIGCLIKSRSYKIEIPVTILIDDLNNNAPLFSKLVYTAGAVSEASRPGTRIQLNLKATDLDPKNTMISYMLKPSMYSHLFSMSTSGVLKTSAKLDYDTNPTIELTVFARDYHKGASSQSYMTSEATVIIPLVDEDDMNPVFEYQIYTTDIPYSNSNEIQTLNVSLRAYDQDSFNSTLRYSLVGVLGQTSENFDIDPISGEIKVVHLDSKLKAGGSLAIAIKSTQTDNPDRYGTTFLRVNVLPLPSIPRFRRRDLLLLHLDENHRYPVEIYVPDVLDSHSKLFFLLKFTISHSEDFFSIDQFSGRLSLVGLLDYERTKEHRMSIILDDGYTRDTLDILVRVGDLNDCRPKFNSLDQFTLRPQWHPGTWVIATIQASDEDENTTLKFSLIPQTKYLRIDSQSGEIYFTQSELHSTLAPPPPSSSAAASTLPSSSYSPLTAVVVVQDTPTSSSASLSQWAELRIYYDTPPSTLVKSDSLRPADQQSIAIVIILSSVIAILIVFVVIVGCLIYRRFFNKENQFRKTVDLDSSAFHNYSSVDGEVVIVSGHPGTAELYAAAATSGPCTPAPCPSHSSSSTADGVGDGDCRRVKPSRSEAGRVGGGGGGEGEGQGGDLAKTDRYQPYHSAADPQHQQNYQRFSGDLAAQENPFQCTEVEKLTTLHNSSMTPTFMKDCDGDHEIYGTSFGDNTGSGSCSTINTGDSSLTARMQTCQPRTSTMKQNSFGKTMNQYLPRNDEVYVNPSTMTIYY